MNGNKERRDGFLETIFKDAKESFLDVVHFFGRRALFGLLLGLGMILTFALFGYGW